MANLNLSSTVRATGFASNDTGSFGSRLAFTLSNGNSIVMMRDPNSASGTGGDHTGVEKFYIYESSDRITWTLRLTINAPAATYRWTAALFANNDIALWHQSNPRTTLRYTKVTYAGWTNSAFETVGAVLSGTATYDQIDGCVTDTNVPILTAKKYDTTGFVQSWPMFVRRTSDSTWQTVASIVGGNSTAQATGADSVSICALGGTATSRNIVQAVGFGFARASGDAGVNISTLSINESTGAQVGVAQGRAAFAIGEANTPTSGAKAQGRLIKLFKSGTNEYTCGVAHSEVNRKYFAHRGTWDGTTLTEVLAPTSSASGFTSGQLGDRTMSITYARDVLNFQFTVTPFLGGTKRGLINYYIRMTRGSTTTAYAAGHFKWNNNLGTGSENYLILGGGDRNLDIASHETIFLSAPTPTNQSLVYIGTKVPIAPIQIKPASGATMVDSNPALAADGDVDMAYYQSGMRIRWQFAKDSLFTTNLADYTQDISKRQGVDGTDAAGVVTHFTDTLPLQLYTLTQGTWYVRAAQVNDFDAQGPWTSTTSFSITHPPAATNLSPAGGLQYVYGSGSRQFTWKFTDPSVTDYQTAYQVEIYNFTDDVLAYQSAKVTSANPAHTTVVSSGLRDKSLGWRVKLWDRDDVGGVFSDYAMFSLADPPAITITNPANGAAVSSGVPTVSFTTTVGGTRRIVKYLVNVTQGGSLVWSSGTVTTNLASGTSVTVTANKSYYTNNQGYSVQVVATDNTGLDGVSTPWGFTTSWTPPASPSVPGVDATSYNVEDQGYISVTWSDSARDPDFAGYIIYRRDDQIDPNTQAVISTGTWTEIGREYGQLTSYEYRDFLAPSGYKVNYRVTQNVNRFGDEVESSNTASTSVFPKSDGYWLIQPALDGVTADAFRLSIVTGDSYTDEYEEAEYTVIGRGRHVDQGEHLGWKGQLDAQIRDSVGKSARQKKLRLETIKQQARVLYLRNPFGDSFRVSVGNMSVSRIAGVGLSEFVDVSIPYSEVSE